MKVYQSKVVAIHAMQFEPLDGIAGAKSPHHAIKRGVDHWYVETLEGPLMIREGDWLIEGSDGEFSPCKDSVFKLKYEPADSVHSGDIATMTDVDRLRSLIVCSRGVFDADPPVSIEHIIAARDEFRKHNTGIVLGQNETDRIIDEVVNLRAALASR